MVKQELSSLRMNVHDVESPSPKEKLKRLVSFSRPENRLPERKFVETPDCRGIPVPGELEHA
jgi:hypothetical protein